MLVRGGGRVEDDELLRRTEAVLEQGARGIVYGRNVIQHPRPAALVAALMGILHDGLGRRAGRRAARADGSIAVMTTDQQPVSVGIIGGGLMGKEAAVAFARWAALADHPVRPELTHVCDIDPAALGWFDRIPSVVVRTTDYHDLLGPDGPEVLYIAVRHDLHQQLYVDAIEAGESLLAEKPFGIDLASARAILAAVERHPGVLRPLLERAAVLPRGAGRDRPRCLWIARPHHRGAQRLQPLQRPRPATSRSTGSARRSTAGRTASSTTSGCTCCTCPCAWAGCLSGCSPCCRTSVPSRPGPDGNLVPCDTIENATLLCTATDRSHGRGETFPLHLTTKRIDPGQKNSWLLRVLGMNGGVEFCTDTPRHCGS